MLSLPEDGTKDVLVRRITTFFGSHPRLRDSDSFTGLFNRAPRRRADALETAQTQDFNNPRPNPSASQASGSALQLPLTTNVANLPVAGSSTSHSVLPPAPLNLPHFGFYPPDMLQNHYNTHHPLFYPPSQPLSNVHPPPQPASTTIDCTQFYSPFHFNSQ